YFFQSIHGLPNEPVRVEVSLNEAPTDPVKCQLGPDQQWLSVLPGVGWDNLVNEERGPTIDRDRYIKCRRSLDGRFLIPDDIMVESKMSSELDLTSEVYDSSSSTRSLTAFSINSAVDIGFSFYKISGDFSFEKESLRDKTMTTKGLIVLSQLRHKRYMAQLLPDSTLHPRFRNRLLDIAAHLKRGNVTVERIEQFDKGYSGSLTQLDDKELLAFEAGMRAFYLADLIVRDYGTHSIVSVDAGGVLVKTDALDETSVQVSIKERERLALSATVNFASLLKIKAGGAYNVSKDVADRYSSAVTHSRVISYGGPIFQANSMNLSDWEKGLNDNLVAIDRRGVPIYELITSRSLPELDTEIVFRLVKTVKSAVERYYVANAVIGCMDPTSVYYDSEANVASTECSGKSIGLNETKRLPLGGIFQKCVGPSELCETVAIKNPATGDFTCPRGYLAVQLLAPQVRNCFNQCSRSAWGTTTNCKQECAVSELFWCPLDPTISPELHTIDGDAGFVFGGLYTDREVNPVTHQYSCPEYSWPLPMGRRMRICLSADRELGARNAMPFGGFYSCRFGNPLVTLLSQNDTSSEKKRKAMSGMMQRSNNLSMSVSRSDSTTNFETSVPNMFDRIEDYSALFSSVWPRRCPNGYSAHLAAMEDTCQVNFCVPVNTIKGKRKRFLKRPPFVVPPAFYEHLDSSGTVEKLLDAPLSMSGSQGERLERVDGDWVRSGSIELVNKDAKLLQQTKISIALGSILAIMSVAVLISGLTAIFCRRGRTS
ncbi:Macrophage expressed protein, partial [Paragonimus heterotremus]